MFKKYRKLFYICLLLVISSVIFILYRNNGNVRLYPFIENNKCGYINQYGKIKLKFENRYTEVYDFHNGYATFNKNGKFGIIDKHGKEIIPPIYDRINPYSEGYFYASTGRENYILGKNGKIVFDMFIKGNYELSSDSKYSDDLIPVSDLNKYCNEDNQEIPYWVYLNKKGDIAFNGYYIYCSNFNEGKAWVRYSYYDKYIYCINTKGKALFKIDKNRDINYQDFSEGLCGIGKVIDNKEKWGFIDAKGNIKIDFKYDSIGKFSDGLAPACLNNKWCYIDENGVVQIKGPFIQANNFNNGLARVMYNDKQIVYINKKGKIIFKFNNDPNIFMHLHTRN